MVGSFGNDEKINFKICCMQKCLYICAVICLLVSCSTPDANKKKVQMTKDLNKYGIQIKIKGELKVESEICALVYSINPSYKILQGYGDCNVDSIKGIDEKENKIIGCYKRAFIQDDTVKLCLMPADSGIFQFPSIQVLFSDNEGNYFVADTSFTLQIK